MEFNVDGVREGLNKAQDLYVVYMAKKGALVKLMDDVAEKRAAADAKYKKALDQAKKMLDEEMAVQAGREGGAGNEVVEAENALKEHQAYMRQEFGIEVNLLPRMGGGTTRL